MQCEELLTCTSPRNQDYETSRLAWANNGIPQTGVTLAINPFGPSVGRVFIKNAVVSWQSGRQNRVKTKVKELYIDIGIILATVIGKT